MSDTLQPQIDALQAQLHDAAAALGQARLSGVDAVTLAQYQMRFNALRSQVDSLVTQEGTAEAAPNFWSRVGDFQTLVSNAASAAGKLISDLVNAADKGVKAAGNTLALVPILVLGGAALLAWLIYKGKLKLPGTR